MAFEPVFWCVWAENGGSPTVKHATFDNAKREAQRLARANPERRFVVLAAAVSFQKQEFVETRFSDNRAEHPSDCMCLDCELPF
jgi:hypothetical protein